MQNLIGKVVNGFEIVKLIGKLILTQQAKESFRMSSKLGESLMICVWL